MSTHLLNTSAFIAIFRTLITQCLLLQYLEGVGYVDTSNPPSHRQGPWEYLGQPRGSFSQVSPRTWKHWKRNPLSLDHRGFASPMRTVEVPESYPYHIPQSVTSQTEAGKKNELGHSGRFRKAVPPHTIQQPMPFGQDNTVGDTEHTTHRYNEVSTIFTHRKEFVHELPKSELDKLLGIKSDNGIDSYLADEPDDDDLEAFEAALHHIEEMSTCSAARCKEPTPFVQFMYDPYARNRVFMPQCTILHRCMNFTGCCGDTSRECVPKKTSIIYRAFLVMELSPGQNSHVEYGPKRATMIPLVNHTECECREKPRLKRCTKRCPVPFSLIREGQDCICNCFTKADEDHWQCGEVKEGVVPLSHDGLVCIKEGNCYKPRCNIGEFNVKSGYCPLTDTYSLQSYVFENPEDRHHYRKHLYMYELRTQPEKRAFVRNKHGKMVPQRRIPIRGVSQREKDRMFLNAQIKAVQKSRQAMERAILQEIASKRKIVSSKVLTTTKAPKTTVKKPPPTSKRPPKRSKRKRKPKVSFSSKAFLAKGIKKKLQRPKSNGVSSGRSKQGHHRVEKKKATKLKVVKTKDSTTRLKSKPETVKTKDSTTSQKSKPETVKTKDSTTNQKSKPETVKTKDSTTSQKSKPETVKTKDSTTSQKSKPETVKTNNPIKSNKQKKPAVGTNGFTQTPKHKLSHKETQEEMSAASKTKSKNRNELSSKRVVHPLLDGPQNYAKKNGSNIKTRSRPMSFTARKRQTTPTTDVIMSSTSPSLRAWAFSLFNKATTTTTTTTTQSSTMQSSSTPSPFISTDSAPQLSKPDNDNKSLSKDNRSNKRRKRPKKGGDFLETLDEDMDEDEIDYLKRLREEEGEAFDNYDEEEDSELPIMNESRYYNSEGSGTDYEKQ